MQLIFVGFIVFASQCNSLIEVGLDDSASALDITKLLLQPREFQLFLLFIKKQSNVRQLNTWKGMTSILGLLKSFGWASSQKLCLAAEGSLFSRVN